MNLMDDAAGGLFAAGCMGAAGLAGFVFYLAIAYCLMSIANKTQTKNGWFAFVPILNVILMINIARKPIWWILLLFIPIANIIAGFFIMMGIAEARGKPSWIGALGMFFPFIVLPYLAFVD